ncbi:hypothetical protein [Arcobacter peruensis]|uniref:hypothetical protein n=1 Tax=Arcobacter peruensis TaxID=2320140 RepID=UPI000F0760AD|nr:hypothetical protein [Arcobacter peruensis]
MKTLLSKNTYCYEFKGHYYFRKRLPQDILKNSTKNTLFRKSLAKVCKDYDSIKNNVDIIIKLTKYLNEQLTIYIKIKGLITIEEITLYIQQLCNEYVEQAIIEYSRLEDLRNESLEIIEGNKIIGGHTINAIAREWHAVNQITKTLSNENVLIEKAKQIIGRSNITKEQLLEIPPDQIKNFYIILIKSEKQVLENDLRIYISSNLHEFHNLLEDNNYNLSQEQKVEQITYKVLNLIQEYPNEKDYIALIKNQSQDIHINTNDIVQNMETITQVLVEQSENTKNSTQSNTKYNENLFELIEISLEKFFKSKNKYNSKNRKDLNYLMRFFKDFLIKNNFTYSNISTFSNDDMENFRNLYCNLPIGNKKYGKDIELYNLYKLNEIRIEKSINRRRVSSIDAAVREFKSYWDYISKHKLIGNIKPYTIDFFNAKETLLFLKERDGEEDKDLASFTSDELNIFIKDNYSNDRLKVILRDSPQNFYIFIIGLLCGCRMDEMMSLRFKENLRAYEKEDKRYLYFFLNEKHPQLSLKNRNAHRNIIIPDILIELGFLNYINKRFKLERETIFNYKYNEQSKASGSTIMYFSRKIKECIPKRKTNNIVQFRSLRKNFSEKLFSNVYGEYDTLLNKKRLIGHEEGTSTQGYVGRIDPSIASFIINSINWSELNFHDLKDTVNEYYQNINEEILYDIKWLEDSKEDWKEETKYRIKKIQLNIKKSDS